MRSIPSLVCSLLIATLSLLHLQSESAPQAFRRDPGHPQRHHGAFQDVKDNVRSEVRSMLHSRAKINVWLRVVGPPKKGRTVYDMGSLSYSCLENSTAYRSYSSSSCSSAQPSDYVQIAEFQQSVESVQKALSMYLGELKEANEHLKSEVASLTQHFRQLKGLDASQDASSNDP